MKGIDQVQQDDPRNDTKQNGITRIKTRIFSVASCDLVDRISFSAACQGFANRFVSDEIHSSPLSFAYLVGVGKLVLLKIAWPSLTNGPPSSDNSSVTVK